MRIVLGSLCVFTLLAAMLPAARAKKSEDNGISGKFVSFDDHTLVLKSESGGSAAAGATQSFDIPSGITVIVKKSHGNEKGLTPGALHGLPKGVKVTVSMGPDGKISQLTVDHPDFKRRSTPTQTTHLIARHRGRVTVPTPPDASRRLPTPTGV